VKALLPARRAVKALDQVALGETPNGYYIPIETLPRGRRTCRRPTPR
jgi:hypothetical protein